MVRNNKHVFWQALILTIVIFGIGLILGFFLESYRADVIAVNLAKSEINLLDEQLRLRVLDEFEVQCEDAILGLFEFADGVYYEARELEKYDSSNQLNPSFSVLHKRYDLLRTLIWLESLELKNKCGNDFHTVVYLYDYNSEDIEVNSKQVYMSRLLFDLKKKYPDKVLLIPIAVNMELSSLDLILSGYNIESFPAIIINEEQILTKVLTYEEVEHIIFQDDN